MSAAVAPLRVLFLDEGVLGGRTLMAQMRQALLGRPDVEPHFVSVPPENRVERQLLRRFDGLGHADMQTLRWRLRWSWRAREMLEGHVGAVDVAFVNTQSCALLSRGVMARLPCVLSVDATARQYAALEYGRPRDRSSPAQEYLLSALERRALDAASGIVAWTDWNAEALRREHDVTPQRLATIHPGLDADWWAQAAARRPSRHDGPLRVLFVGNDVDRKGLTTLTAAVARVAAPIEIDVVTNDPIGGGDGGLRVHRGLSAHSEELRDRYAAADVFALPTRADAVPWVVLEAMASGLPVVASDVGAIGELSGGCGELVKPGDVDGLAAALDRLTNQDRRRRLGRRALSRVREHYDRSFQVPRMIAVLRAAACRKSIVAQVS